MNGVFTHETPSANDIIYGEFKIYHNYDTPKELLVGVARGGLVVEWPRTLHKVNCDGVYGSMLDEDGVPMIRTIDFSPKVTVQMLYLRYFNIKSISNAEADDNWESGNWAGGDGTYVAETSIIQTGIQSAKLTGDADGEGIHEVFSSSLDLENYANGEAGTTADKICFAIYVTTAELAKLDTGLKLKIHCDAEETETNYYYYDIAKASLTADMWTNFTIARSSFTSAEGGSEDWGAVTGISLVFDGSPSSEAVVYIDSISMLMTISDDSDAFSAPIEGQGGNWTYTNETDYKKYTPKINIEESDYLDNVTIIGIKHDGKMIKVIQDNSFNDGNIDLAMGEKDEVVTNTQYTAHYFPSKGSTIPVRIREYTS